MLIMLTLLAAAILVYALYQKRDVTFNVKIWGANMSLEAKGQNEPTAETRSKRA